MSAIHIPAPVVLAVGVASAIMITPAISANADTGHNCSVNSTKGSQSLNCPPKLANVMNPAGSSVPTEQELTLQNEFRSSAATAAKDIRNASAIAGGFINGLFNPVGGHSFDGGRL